MLLGERGREYAAHCYTCSVVCVFLSVGHERVRYSTA